MYTISIINQKGGVGKSTTAHAIGAGLLRRGHEVLFIDLDQQGNLSFAMGANTNGYNVMGVLQRPETIKDEIQHTAQGDIIASSIGLAQADAIITNTGKEYKLREALTNVGGEYDYCIIDTPPHLGIATINALTASNGAIIPAQADLYSIQGILQLNSTIEAVKKYCNPELEVMGILLTRFNRRSVIRREVAETISETARQLNTKLYNTTIRECISLVEAPAVKKDIFSYSPRSNATADYNALLNEIFGEV